MTNATGRHLPPLDAAWLDGGSSHSQEDGAALGQALLALESTRLPGWQEWTGWRLRPAARVGRWLRCHREAVRAELAGRFRRADFYWEALRRQFRSLSRSGGFLAVQTELAEQGVALPSESLAQLLGDEIVVDSHLAAYDAAAASDAGAARAWPHIRYLEAWRAQLAEPNDRAERLIGPRLLARLESAADAKRWKDAIRAGETLLKRFPDRRAYREALARVLCQQALASLKTTESEAAHLRNARLLARAIDRVKVLRRAAPRELGLLSPLAELHCTRAVQLATAGRLSDAFLENERAASYNPGLDQVSTLRSALIEAIQQLQQQVTAAVSSLGPNQQLNPKGQQLLSQARAGFEPGQTYSTSAEAEALLSDFRAARARSVWRDVGLGALPEGDELPLKLFDGLVAIFPDVKAAPADAEPLWRALAAQDAALTSLDAAAIAGFIRARAEGSSWEPPPEADAPPAPTMASAKWEVSGAAALWRDFEPLGPWCFSLDAVVWKIATVAAVVVLIVAGWTLSSEREHRRVRNEAYMQALGAMQAGDYERAATAAGRFLDVRLSVSDDREPEVRRLYSESLVRWFDAQGEAPPVDHPFLTQYRRLFSVTSQARP
jgi:hypothetical protein